MMDGLLDDFVRNLSPDTVVEPARLAELGEALGRAVAQAAAAWPDLAVSPGDFARHLTQRLPAGDPLLGLQGLNATDLYLVCACLQGSASALKALEAAHFGMIEGAVAGLRASPALIDEVKQIVREEVLVGTSGRGPALASYSGRGALGGWLRVTAIRCALRVMKAQGVCAADPDLARSLPDPGNDPELDRLKELYQKEFHESVQAAIRSLSDRDRNLLRYHYIDGLTVDDLAVLYHAHRATVARWIAKVRQEIFEQSRRTLTSRFEVGSAEYESILRLIRSQMHVTLSELLLGGPG